MTDDAGRVVAVEQRIDVWPDAALAGRGASHGLPAAITSFVGRDDETVQVRRLLESGRLITITGVPGSGKTRLAIEAARPLVDRFAHGVRYVKLAACVAAGSGQEAIAGALGVGTPTAGPTALTGGGGARPTVDAITDYLADKEMLLLLDDIEHIAADMAPIVDGLLRGSPRLRVLITSRIPLGVPGEMVWQIPLLDVPPAAASVAEVMSSESAVLFRDRARSSQADFALDDVTAPAVGRIVRRLDGNPLSIELAAARINVLGVADLADRLDQSFDLLSGGRQRTGHHQTLEAAIDWGYELLTDEEKLLFDRLAVFRSEFTLAAAEAVGSGDGISRGHVLDLLGALVDKSMVLARSVTGERVYRLSDALRDYAIERLDERGEVAQRRRTHAEHYRAYALELAPILRSSFQVDTLDRLERAQPNIMAAIDWAVAEGETVLALDIVRSIYLFWFARRHRHASATIDRVLAMAGDVPDATRAGALVGAGMLEIVAGELDAGSQHLAAALVLADAAEAEGIAAEARMYVGIMHQQRGDSASARSEFERSYAAFTDAGEYWGSAWATTFLATVEYSEGNLARAGELVGGALATFRDIGSSFGIGNSLAILGNVTRSAGDPSAAIRHHREALELFREVGDREGEAAILASLAIDERDAGRPEDAAGHFDEAVDIVGTLGNRSWLAELAYLAGDSWLAASRLVEADERFRTALTTGRDQDTPQARAAVKMALEGAAWWSYRSGHIERAVTLFAAVDALDHIDAESFFQAEPAGLEAALTQARARLGSQLYQSLWSGGHSMSVVDAISYALAEPDDVPRVAPLGLSLEEIELGERVAAELGGISERREMRVAGVRVAGRRRRPSGERAPLERQLRLSGKVWLALAVFNILLWLSLFAWPGTRQWWTDRDLTVNEWFVGMRTGWLDSVMLAIHALGSAWFFRPLRWAVLGALVVFKRWRHLFAAVVVFLVVEFIVDVVAEAIGRPRPYVQIIGEWQGFSHPSAPVASLSATLMVIGYTLFPRHKWRNRWMIAAGVLIALLVVSRIYLGVDHATDGVVAALFGSAAAVVVFRWFVPDSVFPVAYRGGRTAHLDVTGERGAAIKRAVSEQLGLEILDMKPFGLEGSGGSTPLRLKVAGDPDTYLFAKLYATNHLRADRWYKIGRTILYGALEDEVRFTSVRRLVEYEDYMMLRMKAAGVPSAEPYGIVEITPEREYVIVTEFLQDAEEISTAEVDDAVIDDALLMVRRLWDAGLAHRDVKPANVLVRDGKIRLIDTAFGTIRPTPWRQAVDLANMMIILALRTSPEVVYEQALRYFAPEDIAEAFAATRSVTIPTQSRSFLRGKRRDQGLDIVARFRQLAPPREPIAIQRWGRRRIGLAVGAALGIAVLVLLFVRNLTSGGFV